MTNPNEIYYTDCRHCNKKYLRITADYSTNKFFEECDFCTISTEVSESYVDDITDIEGLDFYGKTIKNNNQLKGSN